MTLLDTIKQMQAQGMQDTEVIQKLQEQGIDPREINDALNQSRIKAAVSGYEANGQDSVINNASEMQASVISQDQAQQEPQQQYIYPTEAYPQEYYQPQPQGASSETITEIADQIFSEKAGEIKKALNILADFKTITEAKLSSLDSRLKRIEIIIEKLQSSIIGRVGEFGQAITDIRQELGMMQDSFGKVVNKAVGSRVNLKEQETSEQQETQEPPRQPRKKQKDGFENYLAR